MRVSWEMRMLKWHTPVIEVTWAGARQPHTSANENVLGSRGP